MPHTRDSYRQQVSESPPVFLIDLRQLAHFSQLQSAGLCYHTTVLCRLEVDKKYGSQRASESYPERIQMRPFATRHSFYNSRKNTVPLRKYYPSVILGCR
jgi:hypothetical protein